MNHTKKYLGLVALLSSKLCSLMDWPRVARRASLFLLVVSFMLLATTTAFAVGEIKLTGANAQKFPDISADYIAYTDLVVGQGDPDDDPENWANAEIYLMNRVNDPVISTKDIANAGSNQFFSSVWGPFNVWQDQRSKATNEDDIYMYIDASYDQVALTTELKMQEQVQVGGYNVVWQDARYANPSFPIEGDIFLYDLTVDSDGDSIPNYLEASRPSPDPAEFNLTPLLSKQVSPAISGNNVIYLDARSGFWELYLYDLTIDSNGNGTPNYKEAIKPNPDPAVLKISQSSNYKFTPRIHQNMITWLESDLFAGTYGVYAYDLSIDTNSNGIPNYKEASRPNPDPALKLVSSMDTTIRLSPDISWNRVVWEELSSWVSCGTDCLDISGDIHVYDLALDSNSNGIPNYREAVKPNPDPANVNITPDSIDQQAPAISANKVVWEDKRNVNWDIYMKDLDTSAPTGKILINNGDYASGSNNVTITNYMTGSGMQMRYSVDGEKTWSAWEPYAASKDLTLPAPSGPKVVVGEFKDSLGRMQQKFDTIVREIDLTPPVTTYSKNPATADGENGWFKTATMITLQSSESGTTYYSWTSAAGPWTAYGGPFAAEQGTRTLYYYSADGSGNAETVKNAATSVDSVNPVDPTSVTSNSHSVGVYSTNVRIAMQFSGASDVTSGVDGFSYEFTSGSTDVPDQVKDVEETANAVTSASLDSGTYYFHIRTKDIAGNWTSTVHTGPYLIDTDLIQTSLATTPASADGDNNWFKSAATVTLTRNKAGTTYYAWNSVVGPFQTYAVPLSIPSGQNTLYYYSVDGLTLAEESLKNNTLKLDTSLPVDPTSISSSSHTVNVYSTNQRVTVDFSGATDDTSGVDGFSYSFTGGSVDVPDQVKDAEESAGSAISATLDSGTHYFHIRTKDNAGNWTSTGHSGPYKIDARAPGVAFVSGPTGTISTRDATFVWTASDDITPGGSIDYSYRLASYDSGFSTYDTSPSESYTGLPNGSYVMNVKARDSVGNVTTIQRPFTVSISTKTRYEEDSGVVYSASCWNNYNHAAASGGKVKLSGKKNCTASFTYTGVKIEFISAKVNQLGRASIYIDNVLQTTVDLYSSTLQAQQVVYTKTTATSETHTIKINVLRTKNFSSKNYYVPIDAFDVTS